MNAAGLRRTGPTVAPTRRSAATGRSVAAARYRSGRIATPAVMDETPAAAAAVTRCGSCCCVRRSTACASGSGPNCLRPGTALCADRVVLRHVRRGFADARRRFLRPIRASSAILLANGLHPVAQIDRLLGAAAITAAIRSPSASTSSTDNSGSSAGVARRHGQPRHFRPAEPSAGTRVPALTEDGHHVADSMGSAAGAHDVGSRTTAGAPRITRRTAAARGALITSGLASASADAVDLYLAHPRATFRTPKPERRSSKAGPLSPPGGSEALFREQPQTGSSRLDLMVDARVDRCPTAEKRWTGRPESSDHLWRCRETLTRVLGVSRAHRVHRYGSRCPRAEHGWPPLPPRDEFRNDQDDRLDH